MSLSVILQIRSHAQKYFLKVQKSGTGEHLPPPRPKRKAAHPYPQKAHKNGTFIRYWNLQCCNVSFAYWETILMQFSRRVQLNLKYQVPSNHQHLNQLTRVVICLGPSLLRCWWLLQPPLLLLQLRGLITCRQLASRLCQKVLLSSTSNHYYPLLCNLLFRILLNVAMETAGAGANNNCSSSSENTPKPRSSRDTTEQANPGHSLRGKALLLISPIYLLLLLTVSYQTVPSSLFQFYRTLPKFTASSEVCLTHMQVIIYKSWRRWTPSMWKRYDSCLFSFKLISIETWLAHIERNLTKQVLLLMRNLSINLSSPDFEDHVRVSSFTNSILN